MAGYRWFGVSLAVVVALGACGQPDSNPQEPAPTEQPGIGDGELGPFDPQADLRSDLLEVHPNPASPGELVELSFPKRSERGIGYVLEARVEETWDLRFVLSASTSERQEPSWQPADDPEEVVGWPDLAVSGAGPDQIEVPDTAEPGDYRICTANMGTNFCAEIVVTR